MIAGVDCITPSLLQIISIHLSIWTQLIRSKYLPNQICNMAIDLKSPAIVALELPEQTPFLNNLQANILKHHGREHALHLFLRFHGHDIPAVKKWLADLPITSAFQQLEDSQKRHMDKKHDGGLVTLLLLSAKGYDMLDIPSPKSVAFKNGMAKRQNILQDPPVYAWEDGYNDEIHALLILADTSKSRLKVKVNELIPEKTPVVTVVKEQWGEILENEHGIGIEHNGYVDGVSQPIYLQNEYQEYVNNTGITKWDPAAPLSLVLVDDPGTALEDCFGSYFVFRKLDQNVKKFKEQEAQIGNMLPGNMKEMAGALVVGRFEDGTPISLQNTEMDLEEFKKIPNDFDYSNETNISTVKCPFHAHIRKSNPRAHNPNLPPAEAENFNKSRRITRRGIPYDEICRNGNLAFHPEGGVGLLFMAYQASIEDQFEFIQHNWVNDPSFPVPDTGNDPLLGQELNPAHLWENQNHNWRTTQAKGTALSVDCPIHFKDTITLKGGEYFFAPSIPTIKSWEIGYADNRKSNDAASKKKK